MTLLNLKVDEIKTMNTNEMIPECFYIFTNRYNTKLANQIENYNIKLRNGTLVSAGFNNVVCKDVHQHERFLNGDIDYLPFVKNKTTTFGVESPFRNRVIERYTIEYNLEVWRMTYYKRYPSRFSGIFAFGSYNDCKIVANKNGWKLNDVKKYRLVDLVKYNKYIKVVKTNFKIIGLLENLGFSEVIDNSYLIYDYYWKGVGNIYTNSINLNNEIGLSKNHCGTVYEYLIEGLLEEV